MVLVEVEDLCVRPSLREVGEEGGVCPVPTVNGLVGVAHDEEVVVFAE